MPVIPLLIIGGLLSGGYAADKVGEGVNDASTGVMKLALVGIAGFVVLKKYKVI